MFVSNKTILSAMLIVCAAMSLASAAPSPASFNLDYLKDLLSTKIGNAKSMYGDNVNGGSNCAACTIVVALTEQLAIVYNQSIEKSIEQLCSFLPQGLFRFTCQQAVVEFGPIIIAGLYQKKTPDVLCHAINFCRTDSGQPECNLFPKPKSSIRMEVEQLLADLERQNIDTKSHRLTSGICDDKIFKPICDYFNNIFNNHVPGVDIDGDGHSTYPGLRGTSWKGKDCNDFNKNVRPGAIPTGGDKLEDINCNGIYGLMPNSSESYEDHFCKNSGQMGVAVLGDSISAHFHIPEQWLDATQISAAAFEHLLFILENELDWPELSASTGYMNSTWVVTSGPTRSTYLNMLNRNRCNHRDYQNVAVNGARTGAMIDIVKSMRRNQKTDRPLLVGYSLVGNDVCNGHPDTFDHMTKPDEFYNNVVTVMQYLDTVLPNGSHVFLTGLANGSVLYDALHDRIYPLGRVKNDVKYSDMYTYLTCLQISPCNGWMTVNDTERQMTTDYAMLLSGLVKNVTQTYKFKNFDMTYMDLPVQKIFDEWKAAGGQPWQLIEPIDGFHMNQIANAMFADEFWRILTTQYPQWLGSVNPFNDQIVKIFGEQGGY